MVALHPRAKSEVASLDFVDDGPEGVNGGSTVPSRSRRVEKPSGVAGGVFWNPVEVDIALTTLGQNFSSHILQYFFQILADASHAQRPGF
jgi:hypothetical protein